MANLPPRPTFDEPPRRAITPPPSERDRRYHDPVVRSVPMADASKYASYNHGDYYPVDRYVGGGRGRDSYRSSWDRDRDRDWDYRDRDRDKDRDRDRHREWDRERDRDRDRDRERDRRRERVHDTWEPPRDRDGDSRRHHENSWHARDGDTYYGCRHPYDEHERDDYERRRRHSDRDSHHEPYGRHRDDRHSSHSHSHRDKDQNDHSTDNNVHRSTRSPCARARSPSTNARRSRSRSRDRARSITPRPRHERSRSASPPRRQPPVLAKEEPRSPSPLLRPSQSRTPDPHYAQGSDNALEKGNIKDEGTPNPMSSNHRFDKGKIKEEQQTDGEAGAMEQDDVKPTLTVSKTQPHSPPHEPRAARLSTSNSFRHGRSPPRAPRHHVKTPTSPAAFHQKSEWGRRNDDNSHAEREAAPLPLFPPVKPRPSLTPDIDAEVARTQAHRAHLTSDYANVQKATRRALHELELATLELRAAEMRRRVADAQIERAKNGALGIDYVHVESPAVETWP